MTERAAIIGGVQAADALIARLSRDVAGFTRETGIRPGLALVALDDDPVQRLYVRKKVVLCERAGIRSLPQPLAAATTNESLLALLLRLNSDASVHGIFVQWPLPGCVDLQAAARALVPIKDIDGMGGESYPPAAALACYQLIQIAQPAPAGLEVVIAGGLDAFAKPLARILRDAQCGVTLADPNDNELPSICRRADILIAALGKPEVVRGHWIKPGATVIDVGINVVARYDGGRRFVGDVKFEEAVGIARAVTPVPGGIGPMTIACLLMNTLAAAKRQIPGGKLSHG